MHKNVYETNQILSDILKKGEPSSVLRICNTLGYVMQCLYTNQPINPQYFNLNHFIETGIFPVSMEYAISVMQNTFEIMQKSDVLGFVDISKDISRDHNFLSLFPNRPLFFHSEVMDPGVLFGNSGFGEIENPWTEQLAGKKVLVLSSHIHTINEQWKNIDAIWGENKSKIVPFELAGVINTHFHPMVDDRQYPNCEDLMTSIEITKQKIDQYDYDVLLSGIATQSPFFCQHAKERGKIGIHVGGSLQLFFGILGNRWTKAPCYNTWHNMFNEHWKYPLKIDEPQGKTNMNHLEFSSAYWG